MFFCKDWGHIYARKVLDKDKSFSSFFFYLSDRVCVWGGGRLIMRESADIRPRRLEYDTLGLCSENTSISTILVK